MKAIVLSTVAIFGFIASVFFSSCVSEPCKKVVCAHSGVCKDGKCVCPLGYEGEYCETTTRDKFIGIYQVNEDGTLSGNMQYPIDVLAGDNINEVKIVNFQNYFKTEPVIGVCHSDTITINPQVMSNGSTISGWGFIEDTERLTDHYYKKAIITLYYKVVNNVGQINNYGYPVGSPSLWSK